MERNQHNYRMALNLKYFKQYYFYQMFDPESSKIYNYNIYIIMQVVLFFTVLSCMCFSMMSFYIRIENVTSDSINLLNSINMYSIIMISSLKICVFLSKADTIWNLFDVSRIDFLRSKLCRNCTTILYEFREKSIKYTNLFQYMFNFALAVWLITPILSNIYVVTENLNLQYRLNILNLQYPVTTSVYNQNFYIFYFMEMIVTFYIAYYSVLIDNFIISICLATIAQYEIITRAFESIGHEDPLKNKKDNYYTEALEDFKSVLQDQINVYLKLKSFYSTVWIIVVVLIIVTSIEMIVFSYTTIMILLSEDSFTFMSIMKVISTFVIATFQLFTYCYLFDELNIAKESVNFGMYSSNWTMLNLKFKKLLLLAMRQNNVNKLKMKMTTNKCVDVQLFATVIKANYNILSVMLNTLNRKV